MSQERTYLAIDLKSFYASVECIERSLDPLTTCLVVADESRTDKTICLAVTPALKGFGVGGRCRLFEAKQKVKEVNYDRQRRIRNHTFTSVSSDLNDLTNNLACKLDFLIAMPRMALYIKYSTRIYSIYLKYISPEDIHVYSIDEVFMDVTAYLHTYKLTAEELARKMIYDVYNETGITATAGIGTNLFLAKVAMDIVAKKMQPDKYGVRIASLDEMSYRKLIWTHRPLTDIWRVGKGIARKLEANGMYTMGDVAKRSIEDEDLLYKLFGVNAELLIDHAWGYEPCRMEDIKAYKPMNNSLGSGQVLQHPYTYEKAKLVVREMIDALSLDLVSKGLVTNQFVLVIGYDIDNLTDDEIRMHYDGPVVVDYYGRMVPKHAQGTTTIERYTSSSKLLTEAIIKLYETIVNKRLLIRRINIAAINVVSLDAIPSKDTYEQLNLFVDYEAKEKESIDLEQETKLQQAVLTIKQKYGKNAIVKAMNLEEDATAIERNNQIGGHKA